MENTLEILYNGIKLFDFTYSDKTELKALRHYISTQLSMDPKEIIINYNKTILNSDEKCISALILSQLSKLSSEKIRVKILPQVTLSQINKKIKFFDFNSNNTSHVLEFDIISTKISDFIEQTGKYFLKCLEEFNYKIEKCEFYDNINDESPIFSNTNTYIFDSNVFQKDDIVFYFLLKNSCVNIYADRSVNPTNNESVVEIRKDVPIGNSYIIIIQTYNSYIQELEVYPEMTVLELKKKIEYTMNIAEPYQELIYLVYRLKDGNKLLKDYHIRPRGTVFLRGFYFPLIFSDMFTNDRYVIEVNIAEKVIGVKQDLIAKLNLNYDRFDLYSNGKGLEDERNLIDYNIQRFQNIYIK
jgi:hypothetical protein